MSQLELVPFENLSYFRHQTNSIMLRLRIYALFCSKVGLKIREANNGVGGKRLVRPLINKPARLIIGFLFASDSICLTQL